MQTITARVSDKLIQARAIYAEILEDEKSIAGNRDQMLMHAWKLGAILSELKDEIGHGKWLFWLGGNWPELGERNSQRCIAFFRANETWIAPVKSVEFLGFEKESVRKFLWGYLPVKERLQLEGDEEIKPGLHHLTFINQFSKWDRQLRNGQIETFSVEIFRRDIERTIRRLDELCGKGWISSIL